MTGTDYESAVALIGMSGRFPGAAGVAELWDNLLAGVKGLRTITEEELREAGVNPGELADPRYVRVGGPLDGLDRFDAGVFGINPREAETMDPQHRLFLECSWEALEGAGYCPTDVPGQVAVFGGCGFPDYVVQNIQHLTSQPGGAMLMAIGNERDSLASLVSYKLGLRGPAVSVQTFCSTSLVAVHLACQSLLTYECDLAVAGGAFTPLPQPSGYLYEQGGIMSPDGRVRSFDAEAGGTVMGSGGRRGGAQAHVRRDRRRGRHPRGHPGIGGQQRRPPARRLHRARCRRSGRGDRVGAGRGRGQARDRRLRRMPRDRHHAGRLDRAGGDEPGVHPGHGDAVRAGIGQAEPRAPRPRLRRHGADARRARPQARAAAGHARLRDAQPGAGDGA
ncbi:hypothetical protein FHR33_001108 [Nonomuraea dietziae]|uniref:Ketosynthase family 3 (KS3) domain-containing protein n=1 Tax=Nonomuraea dietziae TaxID=65515 RepID=A0A7W5V2M1_9ACTN|nr:hypothetical protein [Nonomuraea dietziae]